MDKFLITRNVPEEALIGLDQYQVIIPQKRFSTEELQMHLKECVAVLDIGWEIKPGLLQYVDKLKVFGTASVGYDHIDVETLTAKGIPLINTPQNVMHATAEVAVGLIFDVMRRISFYDRSIRQSPRWHNPFVEPKNQSIQGKTLGIVGFGRIGRTVAVMMRACGMNVIYNNSKPLSAEIEQKYGATYVSFEELLKIADVVSLHCPYRPANHHIMNKKTFAMMKPSAYFINTARGKLVDENDLIDALKNNVIAGAGIDVYENEPTVSEGLIGLDNVVMTPHIGTLAYDVRVAMVKEAISGMLDVLAGKVPPNIVNGEIMDHLTRK